MSSLLSLSLCDDLYTAVQHRQTPDLSAFVPFIINNIGLGFLNQTFTQKIAQDIETLVADETALILDNMSWQEVGETLQNIAQQWHHQGLYSGWRDEKYSIRDDSGSPLFDLERSAFRPLGLLSHAIHINGWIDRAGERLFWIGKRAAHKAVAPNKLDTTAGGGIAAGEEPHSAMVRESWEEAGVPAEWTHCLQQNGTMFSLRPVHRGLHREILYLYDIGLPENFTPQNKDGEVAEFVLMNDNEIAQAIIAGEFMEDSALTLLISMQQRHKFSATHPLNLLLQQLQHIDLMTKYCQKYFGK